MEVFVEISENVRGEDVFVVQSTCFPANDNVMELPVALDALRRGRRDGLPLLFPIMAMHAKIGIWTADAYFGQTTCQSDYFSRRRPGADH